MDSAWPLLMFLFALMGTGVLILVWGIQTREEELRDTEESAPIADAARGYSGAVQSAPVSTRDADEFALLRSIEHQVRRQTELVAHFVECPTINSLHEDDADEAPEQSLFCRIQKYIELERQLVGEFVSDPSLVRLHGQKALAV